MNMKATYESKFAKKELLKYLYARAGVREYNI